MSQPLSMGKKCNHGEVANFEGKIVERHVAIEEDEKLETIKNVVEEDKWIEKEIDFKAMEAKTNMKILPLSISLWRWMLLCLRGAWGSWDWVKCL